MYEDINIFENNYEIISRKTPPKIVSWITILILTIFIFSILFFNYSYSKTNYYYVNVEYINESYYVNIYVSKNDIKYILEKPILLIDDKIVDYEIVEIFDNYANYSLLLNLQLKQEPIKILELKFILKKTTLFEKLKERIR